MTTQAIEMVTSTSIPNLPVRRCRVRHVCELGHEIPLVAADLISAYDVILPTGRKKVSG